MNDEEFQAVLRYVTETLGRGLRQTERCVLLAAWSHLTYDAVTGACTDCGYSPGTLQRDTAPKLWRGLEKAWQQPRVTKSSFRSTVELLMGGSSQTFSEPFPETNGQPAFSKSVLQIDPITEGRVSLQLEPAKQDIQDLNFETNAFYGRSQELTRLQAALTTNAQRLVVVSGPIGSGKTWLVKRLLQEVPTDRWVFYRRAERVATVADFYRQFMDFVQLSIDSEILSDDSILVDRLIEQLERRQYLIVLDQAEKLDHPLDVIDTKISDRHRERPRERQGYRLLLKALTERHHSSCVVWVSRVRPNLLATDYRHSEDSIHSVSGFSVSEALQWLATESGLTGTLQERQALIAHCAGIPRLLRSAVNEIHDFHNGNIRLFLEQGSVKSFAITLSQEGLLPAIWELSAAERAVLYWLALSPQSRQKLQVRFRTTGHTVSISRVLKSLVCRYLISIEETSSVIRLSLPLLKPLILGQLASVLAQEILNCSPQLLHHYPVLLAIAAEQVRQEHHRLIMQTVEQAILQQLGDDRVALKQLLKTLLDELRYHSRPQSYAIGNLINLAIALNLDLHDWELTGLRIAQADLRPHLVRSVNLAHAQLEDIVFAPGLQGDVCATLDADGSMLAIGDATGGVWVWQYTPQQRLALVNFLLVDRPVIALAFCPASGALVVADDQGQVQFYWDVLRSLSPEPLPFEMDHPSPVTCLQVSSDGVYLAAGRQDGAIVVWECATGLPTQVLNAHCDRVDHLTFSPADLADRYLISCGDDSKTLIWQIGRERPVQTLHATAYYTIRATLYPSQNRVLWAEYCDRTIHLASLDGATEGSRLLFHAGHEEDYVVAVAFSSNGRYFASSGQNKTVQIWDLDQPEQDPLKTLSGFEQSVSKLAFSQAGHLLLTRTRTHVILWETLTGRQLRQFSSGSIQPAEATQRFYEGLNLEQVQGLSEVEKHVLARQGAII